MKVTFGTVFTEWLKVTVTAIWDKALIVIKKNLKKMILAQPGSKDFQQCFNKMTSNLRALFLSYQIK